MRGDKSERKREETLVGESEKGESGAAERTRGNKRELNARGHESGDREREIWERDR
jgi:hypothetical protein